MYSLILAAFLRTCTRPTPTTYVVTLYTPVHTGTIINEPNYTQQAFLFFIQSLFFHFVIAASFRLTEERSLTLELFIRFIDMHLTQNVGAFRDHRVSSKFCSTVQFLSLSFTKAASQRKKTRNWRLQPDEKRPKPKKMSPTKASASH